MRALKTRAARVSCKPRSGQGTRGRRVPAASGRAEPRRSGEGGGVLPAQRRDVSEKPGSEPKPRGVPGWWAAGALPQPPQPPPPPPGFYPRRPHSALPLHGEGSAAGGQRVPAAAGQGGPGRGGGGGSGGERTTTGDPASVAGPSPSPPRALGSASRQPPTPPARCGRAT